MGLCGQILSLCVFEIVLPLPAVLQNYFVNLDVKRTKITLKHYNIDHVNIDGDQHKHLQGFQY